MSYHLPTKKIAMSLLATLCLSTCLLNNAAASSNYTLYPASTIPTTQDPNLPLNIVERMSTTGPNGVNMVSVNYSHVEGSVVTTELITYYPYPGIQDTTFAFLVNTPLRSMTKLNFSCNHVIATTGAGTNQVMNYYSAGYNNNCELSVTTQ